MFGRSSRGTSFNPCTTAFESPNASHDSAPGIRMPRIVSSRPGSGIPPIVSGAFVVVSQSPSSAASFIGCRSATSFAARSPTNTCTGASTSPNVSPTASARR